MNTQEEIKNETNQYKETRRRYYDLNRDKIVARCSELTKNRYKNDPEYREKVKLLAKSRYISKKQTNKTNEKREELKELLKKKDELTKEHKELLDKIIEEHKSKIEEINKEIEMLRSSL